jgi:hypothetical protein
MTAPTAGYSGTPLAKKLGIAEGSCVVVRNAPQGYAQLLEPLPPRVRFGKSVSRLTDVVIVFSDRKAELKGELEGLRNAIKGDAAVWAAWPKKASGVPTDITDNTIREVALPLGFVDVKVCAMSAVWSGLKLVIRKELR